jgi:hypothetical protein
MEAASRHVFNERAGPKKVETMMKVSVRSSRVIDLRDVPHVERQ